METGASLIERILEPVPEDLCQQLLGKTEMDEDQTKLRARELSFGRRRILHEDNGPSDA